MELIASCYREEKGELNRDCTSGNKAGDRTAEARIQPGNTRNCPKCEGRHRVRCIGNHSRRRAGTGGERDGEAFSVKLAHRPAKNVRTRSLPQSPRHLDIEEFEMRSALQFDSCATAIDV